MIRPMLVAFVLLSLVGCPADSTGKKPKSQGCQQSLEFFKDRETGLCFAYCFETLTVYLGGPMLAHVPDEACQ